MITANHIKAILEGFAVGDAMGMSTEFMTRTQIAKTLGAVTMLVESHLSANHSDLAKGTVTDDTEQTLYLLNRYLKQGVTVDSTVDGLLAWIDESDAVAKRYIGPSSLKALKAIKEGVDPKEAGKHGTTCGGLMRTLAPALYALAKNLDRKQMLEMVVTCLIPTHYTSQALEAACAYACAVAEAIQGGSVAEIIEAAYEGGQYGVSQAPYQACAASSLGRLAFLVEYLKEERSEDELLDFLFSVFGTGLESADVFSAVFALFLYAPGETFKSICLATRVGGDTDTIAALVGALNRAYTLDSPIPSSVLETVYRVNNLHLVELSEALKG